MEKGTDQKMELCSSVGLEPWLHGLQFDANLVNKVAEAHDFVPDLKVGRFMPIVIHPTTLLFFRQKNEITR